MFAFLLTVFVGIIIFILLIDEITKVIQLLESIATRANLNVMYFQTILKIIGIAYITELGANITKDAGLNSIAAKIELAGKIFILLLAIPIITAVVDIILSFLPSTGGLL